MSCRSLRPVFAARILLEQAMTATSARGLNYQEIEFF